MNARLTENTLFSHAPLPILSGLAQGCCVSGLSLGCCEGKAFPGSHCTLQGQRGSRISPLGLGICSLLPLPTHEHLLCAMLLRSGNMELMQICCAHQMGSNTGHPHCLKEEHSYETFS